jgi:hypothetical protein
VSFDSNQRLPTSLVSLLCILLGFIGVLYLAATPPQLVRAAIVWTPSDPQPSGNLILSRGWPDSINVESSCGRLKLAPQGVIFDSGGLLLTRDGSTVQVRLPSSEITSRSFSITGRDCDFNIAFDSTSSSVTISAGEDRQTIELSAKDYPRISRLVVPDSSVASIESVHLVTRPTGVTHSVVRLVFLVGSFLLFISAVLLMNVRAPRFRAIAALSDLRPKAIDGFLLFFLLAAALILPALEDDGWIWAILEAYSTRGVFGNLFDNNDAWLPQGHLVLLLQQFFVEIGWEFMGLRLLSALLLTLSWVLLRALVIERGVSRSGLISWASGATFLAFASAWLVGIRAETWVVLACVVSWITLTSFHSRPRPFLLFIGLTASGFALATHQSGLSALGPSAILLWLAWREFVRNHQSRLAIAVSVLGALGVSFLFLFWPQNAPLWVENLQEFRNTDSYSGLFTEIERYVTLLSFASSARVFSILILGFFLFLSALWAWQFNELERLLWIGSGLSLLGLLLTSSKWPWHLGVYAISATILAALLLRAALSRDSRAAFSPRFSLILPGVAFLSALALSNVGRWGFYDYGLLSWKQFSEFVTGGAADAIWILLILSAAIIGYATDRSLSRVSNLTAVFVLSCLLILPLTLSLVWIVIDTQRSSTRTLAKQNLDTLFGLDSCGILTDTSLTQSVTPLPLATPYNEAEFTPLVSPGFLEGPGLSDDPFPNLKTWGTLAAGTGLQQKYATPGYSLMGSAEISLWTSSSPIDSNSVFAVFRDSLGKIVERIPLPTSSESVWARHEVKVPVNSASIRIEIDKSALGLANWVAISEPAIVDKVPASELLSRSTTFAGPYEFLRFPCINFPFPTDGFWPQSQYVIRNASWWQGDSLYDLTLTNVGCVESSEVCVYRSQYPLARVLARPFTK